MSDTMLAIGFGAIILAILIVRAIEWALETRQRRAALEAWQAARPTPRLHENCRSALLDDPTPLNAGVDISCTVTEDDAIRWKVGDEIVSVHSEAGTVVVSKAYAERMGIEGKHGKVVEG